MPASPLEPLLSLASVISTTPTSHVVVAGAGMSKTSGILSAWEVLTDVAVGYARLTSAEDAASAAEDVEEWYAAKYGEPLRYEDLLVKVAPSQLERQQRLRDYFEPTREEREAGTKQPTAAHHALARLVADGFVRAVITLNFDHLIEMAMWDLGLQPLVVKSAEELAKLPALRFLPPVVVHLHGDYTAADSMRNTRVELGAYPSGAVRWLQRVLDEHGLIATGWSAEYDVALVNLIKGLQTRPFTSYWIEPGDLRQIASQLAADAGFVHVRGGADEAFTLLRDAVVSLHERPGPHPLALEVAVATAKRELTRSAQPVAVHDSFRAELARVREAPELNQAVFSLPPGLTADQLYGPLEERCAVAVGLLATLVYWGDANTDGWWLTEVQRLAQPDERRGGDTVMIDLIRLPAVMLFYAAGISALAAERHQLVGKLFNDIAIQWRGQVARASAQLTPASVYQVKYASERLHQLLLPIFTRQLGLSAPEYIEHWETLELIGQADAAFQRLGPDPAEAYLDALTAVENLTGEVNRWMGTNDIDALEAAEKGLRQAKSAASTAFERLKQGVWMHPLHVRIEHAAHFSLQTETGQRLLDQLTTQRQLHWLTQAGLFGGQWQIAWAILSAVNVFVGEKSNRGHSLMYYWMDTGAGVAG